MPERKASRLKGFRRRSYGGIFNGLPLIGVPGGTITTNNIKIVLNVPDNCEPLGTVPGCSN